MSAMPQTNNLGRQQPNGFVTYRTCSLNKTYERGKIMLDGMVIRVACKMKDLQKAIEKAWTQAEAKKYPHA